MVTGGKRKERLDRGINVRSQGLYAISSWRAASYLIAPRMLLILSLAIIPLFMPIVAALGFDPIWFVILILINCEMGFTTPPFGLTLFVMKGVAPPDTKMSDIYLAGIPFLVCDAIAMAIVIAFPQIALWLPGLIK